MIGCADTKPASLELGVATQLTGIEPVTVAVTAKNVAGEPVPLEAFQLTAVPNTLAKIDGNNLTCLKTGDVGLTATGAGLTASATISCSVAADIEVPAELALIANDPALELPFTIHDHNGVELDRSRVHIESTNPTVLVVNGTQIQGKMTGVAAIVMRVDGVEKKADVNVVEIKRLDVPSMLFAAVGDKASPVPLTAYGIDGNPIKGVVARIESADPSIIAVEESKLRALKTGSTSLTINAGSISQVVTAASLETIAPRPVRLADGAQQVETFAAGHYIVSIKTRATDGSRYGVTAQWSGVPCKGSNESQTISLLCDVPSAATLIIANPTGFGMGPGAVGQIEIMAFGADVSAAAEAVLEYERVIDANKKN